MNRTFLVRLLPLFGLLALLTSPNSSAVPLVEILKPTPGASIPEGGGPAIIDFRVMNNSGVILILDYAFCSISHGPPDPDDFANFTGNNGSGGLLGGDLIIAPGQIGHYTYSFSSPPDAPADAGDENADFGRDPVFFALEMSPLGNHTPPPINRISSAIGFVAWVDQGAYNAPNPVALNALFNLQNPQPNLLYQNGIIGMDSDGNPFGLSLVQVNDTPEPVSSLLIGTGLVSLAGVLRRRATRHNE